MMSDQELFLRENIAFCEEMLKKHKYSSSMCAMFRRQLQPFKAELEEMLAAKAKQNSLQEIVNQAKQALADIRAIKVA